MQGKSTFFYLVFYCAFHQRSFIITSGRFFLLAIPEDAINDDSDDEDKSNPDERISIRASDKRIAPDNEYSDSEDEGDRRDQR